MIRSALLIFICCFALACLAQQPNAREPHLGYVYPAGGEQGTTFEVVVGGQFLDGVSSAHFSVDAVSAQVVEHIKPLTPGQAMRLREQVQEMLERKKVVNSAATTKATWTADDEKKLAEIQKKLLTVVVRKPSSPAIAEAVRLQVKIDRNVKVGTYELRLRTPLGLTNPLIFCVGQLHEFSKPAIKLRDAPIESVGRTEMSLTLPAMANGQIGAGAVDRWTFFAHRGQKIVAQVSARQLIPYIADAVPGWFQPTLCLCSAGGKELAYVDDYRFNPDPVLCCQIPQDGQYFVEIKDSIYRGREDFVYRIAIGEIPFATGVFPLGARSGTKAQLELKGLDLTQTSVLEDCTEKSPGLYTVSGHHVGLISNAIPFAVDDLPETLAKAQLPRRNPQDVELPIIINGRIEKPGAIGLFRFRGHANQQIVAEVNARRLGSPLDSTLKLVDSSGKQIAFNDDFEDKAAGLETHHADSYIATKLPADGDYLIEISDAQQQGGSEFAYRLRISEPRPDFTVRIVPSAIQVRTRNAVPVTIYAIRRDGYDGPINISLREAKYFTLKGEIPAKEDHVKLFLNSRIFPPTREPISLDVVGEATIADQLVTHPVVPADDMMQAFFYHHLVPAQQLLVSVLPPRPYAVLQRSRNAK